MEATSSSTSKRNINEGIIKFKNRKFSCGIKAGEPNTEEFNLSEYTENITQRYDGRASILLEQAMEDLKVPPLVPSFSTS
ncbi:hypothetical protein Ddye_025751 [Dipteronia dyeriana]|uniref:Uncharacterized protein n=1 Tax=Dipteronia dyeriana TaxID=168575 RepID=A0AAD9TLG1_9ROSI|nr:hypothetical protein Ddye_025751 [Dipteronia dyeriana]